MDTERTETVIIGGSQAGLAVGYHLAQRGRDMVILEGSERIGDAWRNRWDSLHLFTPARHDSLPGWAFPAKGWSFPSKDEMGDYLEAYATKFRLPVRTGVRVDRVSRRGDGYLVEGGGRRWEAANVVVATGPYQTPKVPGFAAALHPDIRQFHSSAYRRPSQFADGSVLVIGAGNSGVEIALEAARTGHRTTLAGRHPGNIPFDIEGTASRLFMERFVLRFLFHRVFTLHTPIGRRVEPKFRAHGGALIRVKPKQLDAAGIQRTGRVTGTQDGRPVLEDGRVLDVGTVAWATGFGRDFSWIDTGPLRPDGEPSHERGVVEDRPGMYFVGLHFLHAMSSSMVHGVSRDAEHIARHIAEDPRTTRSPQLAASPAGT
ncbi:MAG TPA: NAD(P)-binding domain-containing protein [Actinomycetota bacterium]|nr:NAD(P)-binding domain-containing protein [Actinomycetota bacterium]